jgi:hypothetical protein
MKEYKADTKAFIDGFGGMIPCTVLQVKEDCEGHIVSPHKKQLVIRVDETRGGYQKGEILDANAFYTPPRAQRVKRKYSCTINTGYRYVVSSVKYIRHTS